jgi:hypothetical protein
MFELPFGVATCAARLSSGGFRCRKLGFLLLMVFALGTASAQVVVPAPMPPQRGRPTVADPMVGLAIEIDSWDAHSAVGGYYPVFVSISNSRGPRRLTIELVNQAYPTKSSVSRTIELAANSRSRVKLSVPVMGGYFMYELRVREGSREHDKLRTSASPGNVFSGSGGPTVLTLSPVDVTPLLEATRLASGRGCNGNELRSVAPADLSPDWIDYTTFDLIVASVKQLEQMTATSREAICRWAMAGGTLVVYGAGDDRENSPVVNRLLDLPRRGPADAHWEQPRIEDRHTRAHDREKELSRVSQRRRRIGFYQDQAQVVTPLVQTPPRPFSGKPHFSFRPFGLGQLVVIGPDNAAPGTIEDWCWVMNALGPGRLVWLQRHGMTARGENPDFWNMLIPGVGKVPVSLFQASIVLFAVVIGPVNYLVLKRQRRLPMLILSAPLLALVAAMGLLGYAIASDGFAIRTRTRSVTVLDQVRGEVVSWSRISYYAGLAPSRGLQFSTETAVYPIDPEDRSMAPRAIDWTQNQNLRRGWLPARTLTQLLTISHRTAEERIEIVGEPSGAVRVRNNLGVPIRKLVLCDERGALHTAGRIDRDGRATLTRETIEKVHAELRSLVQAQKAEIPKEIEDRDYELFFTSRWRFFGYNGDVPESSTSLMEQVLKSLSSDAAGLSRTLRPRTYVAIADAAPAIEYGVPGTQDEGSLFVIVGWY